MFIVQRERGYLDPAGVALSGETFVVTYYRYLGSRNVLFDDHTPNRSGSTTFKFAKRYRARSGAPGHITEHCSKKLGIKPGETTTDGRFTLSEVECLGSCGTVLCSRLNFDYHENLTPEKVDQILAVALKEPEC